MKKTTVMFMIQNCPGITEMLVPVGSTILSAHDRGGTVLVRVEHPDADYFDPNLDTTHDYAEIRRQSDVYEVVIADERKNETRLRYFELISNAKTRGGFVKLASFDNHDVYCRKI